MNNLDGCEQFHFQGTETFSVLDFWRFAYSQLLTQTGPLTEFIVAKALGIAGAENVDYWTAFDMTYQGKRVEVKATRYVHPWNKTRVSEVRSFSIAPTSNRYWSGEDANGEKMSRQSDLYIFCLHTSKDLQNQDALCLDDWLFYPVLTADIDAHCNPEQKTISLGQVQRLAGNGVDFAHLRATVDGLLRRE